MFLVKNIILSTVHVLNKDEYLEILYNRDIEHPSWQAF